MSAQRSEVRSSGSPAPFPNTAPEHHLTADSSGESLGLIYFGQDVGANIVGIVAPNLFEVTDTIGTIVAVELDSVFQDVIVMQFGRVIVGAISARILVATAVIFDDGGICAAPLVTTF